MRSRGARRPAARHSNCPLVAETRNDVTPSSMSPPRREADRLLQQIRTLVRKDTRGDGASRIELDAACFDADRASAGVLERIHRDVDSGLATGEVLGTPTIFIDGVVHRGSYDAASLLQEVTVS
jgi:protein-disulfide isomerase